MFSNTRTLRIEWGDCDPAGIVFYPRYFAMFDTSTTSSARQRDLSFLPRESAGEDELRYFTSFLPVTASRFL